MPNHVRNILKIAGPGAHAAALKYFRKVKDEESGKEHGPTFDFNALIPMPEIALKVVENGIVSDVLSILAEGSGMVQAWENLRRFDRDGDDHMGPWKGLAHLRSGEVNERLERAFPGCIANARAMASCIGETGFKSWYSWSVHNWGTKWNAYDASLTGGGDSAEMRFDTAWSVPLPVLQALAKAEPALSFRYWAFDEGWNFYAIGTGDFGLFSVAETFPPLRESRETVEVYKICYGTEPEPEEAEESA